MSRPRAPRALLPTAQRAAAPLICLIGGSCVCSTCIDIGILRLIGSGYEQLGSIGWCNTPCNPRAESTKHGGVLGAENIRGSPYLPPQREKSAFPSSAARRAKGVEHGTSPVWPRAPTPVAGAIGLLVAGVSVAIVPPAVCVVRSVFAVRVVFIGSRLQALALFCAVILPLFNNLLPC
jgi:hypothetical protein